MDIHEWEQREFERQREQRQSEAERAARLEHLKRNPPQSEIDRIEAMDASELIAFVFGASPDAAAISSTLTGGDRAQLSRVRNALIYRLRFKENWSASADHATRRLWRLYEETTSGKWSGSYPDIEERRRIEEQKEAEQRRMGYARYVE